MDNFFLHPDLVFRIARVELPGFDPGRVALLAQGQLALGFGNLFLEGDHRQSLRAGQGHPPCAEGDRAPPGLR